MARGHCIQNREALQLRSAFSLELMQVLLQSEKMLPQLDR